MVSCILIFLSFTLFDCTYNYFLRGSFQGHSSSNRFVTTMVFYNATREDGEYIEDDEVKQLFWDIYDVCDEKGYLGSHAGDGWYNEADHFGDHYDHIQIDTMWPMILQHARETIDSKYASSNLNEETLHTYYDSETDRLNSIIINSILPHQLPKLAKSLWNNFLSGLVVTVAQKRPILIPYTILIYVIYLLLTIRLIWHLFNDKKSCSDTAARNVSSGHVTDKNRQKQYLQIIQFAGITLLGIFSNVFLVSSVIFCQTRYTIYNMPLFYMVGAVLHIIIL